jgi:uncharacterized protein with PIN domain
MKKLLLILLCLPIIGFASFPVITDTKEAERIVVTSDYDVHQKTYNEKNNIKINKSSVEKNIFWKVYRLVRLTVLYITILFCILIVYADITDS